MTSSVVALLAVAGVAFLSVHLVARVLARSLLWVAVVTIWCAAIAAIVFVDVNIPLSESHLYPSDAPAPLWLALCAIFAKFAALASIIVARRPQPSTREDAGSI